MALERKIDFVVLGLLNHEPLTGYEIKKRIDTSLSFFWNASFGSIYPTLAKLEEENKVIKLDSDKQGREKIVYAITETGKNALKDWLQLPVQRDELHYETLLKLFFGDCVGVPKTLEHIVAFEEKTKKGLAYLQGAVNILEKIKDTEPAHQYYLLTAKFGVKTFEAYLDWCAETKALLEQKK